MKAKNVDDQLLNWDDLKDDGWAAVLLGNGFSVNIWHGFNYHSLYELADSEAVDFPLSGLAVELFNKKDTTNFERILNLLLDAMLAYEVTEGEQSKKLKRLYGKIQKSLISAVQKSHVAPDLVDTMRISTQLLKYETVFTTNYDLIPYWSIMDHSTNKFRDYFWGNGNSFDINDTDLYHKCTRILYLHGALHILEDLEGSTVWKNTAGELNLLDQFPDTFGDLQRPLFITEGDAKQKLARIHTSEYLRFAYNELRTHNNSLVVIGHSLDHEYDKHLTDAIYEWDGQSIAVSIWPGMSSHDIISFKARLNKQLTKHHLYYFDSTTHPLCNENLSYKDKYFDFGL